MFLIWLKTLLVKEKMLVFIIFSFFYHVFNRHLLFYPSQFQFLSHIYFVTCKCFQFGPVLQFIVWSRINSFPNDKILDLLAASNFSFSYSVFYAFGELSTIFIESEIFCLGKGQYPPSVTTLSHKVDWSLDMFRPRSTCKVDKD